MWNTELIMDTLTTITANYAPVGGGILVLGSEKGIIMSPPYAGGSPWLSYDTMPASYFISNANDQFLYPYCSSNPRVANVARRQSFVCASVWTFFH